MDASCQIRELLESGEGHCDRRIRNRSFKLVLEFAKARGESEEMVCCDG